MFTPWFGATVLECDRQAAPLGKCWVKNMLGIPLRELPATFVQHAEVRTNRGGRFTDTRLVLHTKTGEIRFASALSDAPTYMAGQINAFVGHSEQKTVRVMQDDRLPGFCWGLFIWLGSGAVFVAACFAKES